MPQHPENTDPLAPSEVQPAQGEPVAEDAATMHRRMLMAGAGLLGAAALSRVAHAGPLSPPPGPIASTGRTTDELYLASTKGCIPLNQTTAPGNAIYRHIISQPGSYYLTAEANAPVGGSAAIYVEAGGVTINLNGFSLNRLIPAQASNGITFATFPTGGGRVHNGIIYTRAGGNGIALGCDNVVVEDVCFAVASSGAQTGIALSGSAGTIVRRCTVSAETQSDFVIAGGGDNSALFEDCVCAPYAPIGSGIALPQRSLIRRCIIGNVKNYGINLGDGSAATDCRVHQCGGNSIQGGNEVSVERCHVFNGVTGALGGIQVSGLSRVAFCYVDLFPNAGQYGVRSVGFGTYILDNQISRCNIGVNFQNVANCYAFRNFVNSCPNGISVSFGGNWYPSTADINAATNPLANVFS